MWDCGKLNTCNSGLGGSAGRTLAYSARGPRFDLSLDLAFFLLPVTYCLHIFTFFISEVI